MSSHTLSLDRVVGKQMTLKFWFLKNHLDSASNGDTGKILTTQAISVQSN